MLGISSKLEFTYNLFALHQFPFLLHNVLFIEDSSVVDRFLSLGYFQRGIVEISYGKGTSTVRQVCSATRQEDTISGSNLA